MIKVATILPQRYLHLTEQDDYHMCLAHLISTEGMDSYTEFFKKRAKTGSYVIMDNGLIEGDPQPMAEIVARAELVRAHEIILPDAYQDCLSTLHMVENALNVLKNLKGINKFGLMAVPQGRSLEEWIGCALSLSSIEEISCLGIPKNLTVRFGRDARLEAIMKLADAAGESLRSKELHLLGCWTTPLELTVIAKAEESDSIPLIRGVDSAIAYNYARGGLKINHSDRPDQEPIDFKKGALSPQNVKLLEQNIKIWRNSVNLKSNVIYM